MGDDAEYYMEQQAEEEHQQLSAQREVLEKHKKFLYCWVGGKAQDLWWEWKPMSKEADVFAKLHNSKSIGREYFLCCSLPVQDDIDWEDPIEGNHDHQLRNIDGLEFGIADNEIDATSEVLVLTKTDASALKVEMLHQKNTAKNLKDKIISEMLQEMISIMEAGPNEESFLFARDI